MKQAFTANQTKSIISRYTKRGESSIKIGQEFGVSSNVILRHLRDNKVKIRGRGRYAMA